MGGNTHSHSHSLTHTHTQLTIAVNASVRFVAQLQLQLGQTIARFPVARIGAIEGKLIGDLYRLHQQNVLIGRLMTHITFLACRSNGQLNCGGGGRSQ